MSKISLLAAGLVFAFAGAPVVLATETAPPVEATADEGEKVVCKRIEDTGSRVRKTKVCHTKAEWDAQEKGAQETLRGIQQKGVQPGGDSLQPG